MGLRGGVIPLVVMVLVALPTTTSPAATKVPSPTQQAKQRLAQLSKEAGDARASVRRRVAAARKGAVEHPCRAARRLRALRLRGDLRAQALSARAALMVLPGTRSCGGSPSRHVGDAKATVLESSAARLRVRISLPAPTFAHQRARGADYQEMFMAGMGQAGRVGTPSLPALEEFFAVPEGANASVVVDATRGYDLDRVNLYPLQPQPVDGERRPAGAPPDSLFQDEPFVRSRSAYASRRRFPARVAKAAVIGKMRDLRIGGVDAVGGQYSPRAKRLRVLTQIDVTVRFGGASTRKFASAQRLQSPWESVFARNYGSLVLNWDTVLGNLDLDDLEPEFCGEDMLIVTSPALHPAAATFASARQAAGYATKVVDVGDAPGQIGTTLEQIRAFVLAELNAACTLRPTYVVLFGDTSHVPTWHPPCAKDGDPAECNIPSDLPYSLNGADLFADVQLGRIPAHDLDAANAVVKKITTYETTMPAPAGDDFYDHATVTAYFEQRKICVLNEGQSGEPNCKEANGPVTGHYQPDYPNRKDARGFTKTAERIQNTMAQEYGHTVDRVYTKGDDDQVIPEQYYDGTPIPPNLLLPGFPWNGTGADLLGHYNDGRFAILHRDHGWQSGWSHPTLSTADTPSMTNGTQLPVIFGVNCSSANFDIPGNPSFVETQVMKPSGGAVAGFGDTQVSPTWPNNHMALGFFDAPFPKLLPTFGSDTPTKRFGDILLSGKNYMAAKNDGAGEYKEHYLYHLLGDPSGQMWSNDPKDIDVTKINVERIPIPVPDPGGPVYKVLVNMGSQNGPNTIATLMRNGQAIGRGVVGAGGSTEITPEIATPQDGLTVAFEQDGALPDQKAIDGGSPGPAPPPPGPAATTMAIRCPSDPSFGTQATFSGHLDPAFAGAEVRVRYTRTGGRSFEQTVRTGAGGDWTDSATFARTDIGEWKATATFAGDASHQASSAECTFTVGR